MENYYDELEDIPTQRKRTPKEFLQDCFLGARCENNAEILKRAPVIAAATAITVYAVRQLLELLDK